MEVTPLKKKKEVFVEVGVTAMRDPMTGDFLPARPLYIKATEEEMHEETGMMYGEEHLLDEVARVFAGKMKKYVDDGGLGGIQKG